MVIELLSQKVDLEEGAEGGTPTKLLGIGSALSTRSNYGLHRNCIHTAKHGIMAGHTSIASDAKQRRKEQEKVERLQAK